MIYLSLNCLICGNKFSQKRYKQSYCCRKCYEQSLKSSYEKSMLYPSYLCECGHREQLNFDPTTKSGKRKWLAYECSNCHKIRH